MVAFWLLHHLDPMKINIKGEVINTPAALLMLFLVPTDHSVEENAHVDSTLVCLQYLPRKEANHIDVSKGTFYSVI